MPHSFNHRGSTPPPAEKPHGVFPLTKAFIRPAQRPLPRQSRIGYPPAGRSPQLTSPDPLFAGSTGPSELPGLSAMSVNFLRNCWGSAPPPAASRVEPSPSTALCNCWGSAPPPAASRVEPSPSTRFARSTLCRIDRAVGTARTFRHERQFPAYQACGILHM